MPRSFLCSAIVLKTYDVGEADRFCILLTPERGRLAARAAGARKPKSRLGGYILPFRHIALELKEGNGGFYVSSVASAQPSIPALSSPASFSRAGEGIEILLALVQHEEPDRELFAATLAFLSSCGEEGAQALLVYTIRLLSLLGLLPGEAQLFAGAALTGEEREFFAAARDGNSPSIVEKDALMRLRKACVGFVHDHLSVPLKAPLVSAALE
jgi:recombinational DNA repair protein (RecF pathway)